MSRDELLAAILQLPRDEQRSLMDEVKHLLPIDETSDPDFTPEILAELETAHQDMLDNPGDEMSWEEVCAELDREKQAKLQSNGG